MTELRRLGSSEQVSKPELIVFIKQSKIWKGIIESKATTCTQSPSVAKVNKNFICVRKMDMKP